MSKRLQPAAPEPVEPLIQIVRGERIILDVDLARLYGVPTKRLNEQVKRNLDRFPPDFLFQLTPPEFDSLRSQFATLNEAHKRSQSATGSEHHLKSQIATSSLGHGGRASRGCGGWCVFSQPSTSLVLCLSPAALGSDWVGLAWPAVAAERRWKRSTDGRGNLPFRDLANAGRCFIPLLLADCKFPDTLRRFETAAD